MKKEFTVSDFIGFYDSLLEANIDYELDEVRREAKDEKLGAVISEVIYDSYAFDHDKWAQAVCLKYSNLYLDAVRAVTKGGFKLVSFELTSPKQYNFETDNLHITSDLSEKDFDLLHDIAKEPAFALLIEEECASRDGFHSNYSNNINAWPIDIRDWDNIQLGHLIGYIFKKEVPTRDDHYDFIEEVLEDLNPANFIDNSIVMTELSKHLATLNLTLNIPNETSYYELAINGYIGTDRVIRLEDTSTEPML